MYTLRCTKLLLARIDTRAPLDQTATTTALGDWYANRLNIGHHRLVLCTNERSLLSVVVPAKDLPGLPGRLVESLALLLRSIDIPSERITREIEQMKAVRLAPTASRSVLGSMNDFAVAVDAYFHTGPGVLFLTDVDRWLADTPCGPIGYRDPRTRAREILLGP